MMGGRIEARSTPGQGSVFHFTVPFRALDPIPGVVVEPKPALASLGLRLLVAEDNAINRKILAAQLDALGCPHTMAMDGEEVLTALRKEPLPDVVLMDCHMPNLDGWEATRRIRGWSADPESSAWLRRAAGVPIIALTAAALPEERMRCLDAGMNDFLTKPAKLADLQRALKPFTRLAAEAAV
jgi:CheY-like chemotaxis protein